ncbi:hypothetical protein [Pseudorhodoferax sp.]|uniref:hypothetical protein n=1 Tax=Pseudorhodoferax sp. TaxID=1993553 RepID=UPI0039E5DE19
MSELGGLIKRGLNRMNELHVHELGRVLEAALSVIHPNKRGSGRESLRIFTSKSVETMNEFLQSTRDFVLSTVKSTNTVLTRAKVDELISLVCAAAFAKICTSEDLRVTSQPSPAASQVTEAL